MKTQNISPVVAFGIKARIDKNTFKEVQHELVKKYQVDFTDRERAFSVEAINDGLSHVVDNIDSILEKIFQKRLKIAASKNLKRPKDFLKKVSSEDSFHAKNLIPNYDNEEIGLGLERQADFNSGMGVVVKMGKNVVDHYYGLGINMTKKGVYIGFVSSLNELLKPFFDPKIKEKVLAWKKLETSDKQQLATALDNLKNASEIGHF